MKLECIVVGIDGSENAAHALDWAIALATPSGARVVAIHALGLLDRLGAARVPTAANRDDIVAAFRNEWCGALDRADIANERVVADGPPADVVLRTADEHRADVIVVGERGIGRTPERMLGSTSQRVLAASDRPVLVVPQRASG